jgi:VanZ family protein
LKFARTLRIYKFVVRAFAWAGILTIIVLSVVPAVDRPVTGSGQNFEHFVAYALTASAFALGYELSLVRLSICAFLFCGGIELLQALVPTRHARVSDFVVDLGASWLAMGTVIAGKKLFGAIAKDT